MLIKNQIKIMPYIEEMTQSNQHNLTQEQWLDHPIQLFKNGRGTIVRYSQKTTSSEFNPIFSYDNCEILGSVADVFPVGRDNYQKYNEEMIDAFDKGLIKDPPTELKYRIPYHQIGISSRNLDGSYTLFVDGKGNNNNTIQKLHSLTKDLSKLVGDPLSCHVYYSGNSFHTYWPCTISYEKWVKCLEYLSWLNSNSSIKFDQNWLEFSLVRGFGVLRWSYGHGKYMIQATYRVTNDR